MQTADYDLVVIGSGPGGYTGAIRAAQLGMRVACVEKQAKLGGTCLLVGCIPSKTLLEATEKFVLSRDHYGRMGIRCENVAIDLPVLMARKDKVVDTLSSGITGLFKKNKVDKLIGMAEFLSANQLKITGVDGEKTITARKILIATGSVPIELPHIKFNAQNVISSDQAIALQKVPEHMTVIGAGAIGLELSSVWQRLGTKVTVLEMMPGVLPGVDDEMRRLMERTLRDQGLEFYFNVQATGVKTENGKLQIGFVSKAPEAKSEETFLSTDIVLVAVGRRAYTEGLRANEIGVNTDNRGRILVNHAWETSAPNVFAIGDVISGPMLAHKAEEEAIAAVELMAGKAGHVNYDTIPSVVYTAPEFAWVGKTEEQLKETGIKYKTGKFRFTANARALSMDEAQGMVKILAEAASDRVLGVHIIGPQASSLISEAVIAMELGASSEDIARTCHAHPSLPEAIREAALGVEGRTINS
ncbi:MAG TPA: dihydrolipoyl dehydrogenase [Phycisphaerae bacterium]|nr:dihydrolipoyl dehydrogenase [Phycisphaerae bacterium]